jgi:hypothetical protein
VSQVALASFKMPTAPFEKLNGAINKFNLTLGVGTLARSIGLRWHSMLITIAYRVHQQHTTRFLQQAGPLLVSLMCVLRDERSSLFI